MFINVTDCGNGNPATMVPLSTRAMRKRQPAIAVAIKMPPCQCWHGGIFMMRARDYEAALSASFW